MRKVTRFVWLVAGVVESLIGLRVLLKLMAANPNHAFAAFIYRLSDWLLVPFLGLTVTPSFEGIVLEIPALIAMLAYALAAWGLVELLLVIFSRSR